MHFRGRLFLANTIIIQQLEGELKPQLLENGKTLYRGHFATTENPVYNQNVVYTLQTTIGLKTKVKVLSLLSDLGGIKVFSMYATHPLK
jgi:hypothetical protein